MTKQVFVAKTDRGLHIISVLAADEAEARQIIAKELDKNPSRRPYLAKWRQDGEIVEVKVY